MSSILRRLSASVAESVFFHRGKEIFARNETEPLELTKGQKLLAGGYLILRDFGAGQFPPTFEDQQAAYRAEIEYMSSMPGVSRAVADDGEMRKPFWLGRGARRYLGGYLKVLDCFEKLGVRPPARILELGCGSGWMAEFLAQMRFEVTGTTISDADVEAGMKRKASLETKGIRCDLRFVAAPMESVHQALRSDPPFDAVFVYEALHHAFSWEQTIESSRSCLKKGGWLMLCNEPNLVHTFSSYRVAKLTNTHEIGMSRRKIVRQMKKVGFEKIIAFSSPFHFFIRDHWIAAQR